MKVSDLRGILQYVPRFRDRIFVVAVDGEIVASPNFANILLDIAVLRSLNIRVVLVHGAAEQIRALSDQHQVPASDFEGAGVTDAATLRVAIMAANPVTHQILEGLALNDIRAAHTNALEAVPAWAQTPRIG